MMGDGELADGELAAGERKVLECGCTITNDGAMPDPFVVAPCPEHSHKARVRRVVEQIMGAVMVELTVERLIGRDGR